MNQKDLEIMSGEALKKADKNATRLLSLVIKFFIFSLVTVAGYSGYRQGQGTNLPWSVWIPPLFLGSIATFFAFRRLKRVKEVIMNRTNNQ